MSAPAPCLSSLEVVSLFSAWSEVAQMPRAPLALGLLLALVLPAWLAQKVGEHMGWAPKTHFLSGTFSFLLATLVAILLSRPVAVEAQRECPGRPPVSFASPYLWF